MATTPEFSEAYKKLNVGQKLAVDSVEGPVMVVAGPGTGKTQVLTLRIANILLKTQAKPENILALTYTESGAHAMKKRLAKIIGSAAYKVRIATFHGFATELIATHPEKFPSIIGGIPVTEVEQIEIMTTLLDGGVASILRPHGDPHYYVHHALSAIHTLKREGVSPKDFDTLLKEEGKAIAQIPDLYHEKGAHKGKMKGAYVTITESLEKTKALSELYHAYQAQLRAMKRFDYEDMILETVEALEGDADFLLVLQEQFQYILADEHQDTNNAQNRILELLASFHDRPNLFIVGDEKQAIYRFQGASLANFLYFQKKYPDVVLVELTENYRSTQSILDSAHTLITREATEGELKLRVPLVAKGRSDKNPILVAHLSGRRAELEYIASDIEARKEKGESLEEIAVFARGNHDIRELGLVLSKRDIPYHMLSESDVLLDEDANKLLRLIRAAVHFGEDGALIEAFGNDHFNIDHLDLWKLIQASHTQKRSVHEILRGKDTVENGPSDIESLRRVYTMIHSWSVGMKNRHALSLVEEMIRDSGLLKHLLRKPEGSVRLRAIDRLYDELQSLSARDVEYTLHNFLSHIDTLRKYKKGLETSPSEERAGVRLMSAHKSKGLEFDHVYLLNASERAWEGRTKRTYFRTHLVPSPLLDEGDVNDERRLFYVGLTRARKSVTITFAEVDQNGKPATPSRFISDIDPTLLRHNTPVVDTPPGDRYEERVHLEPRLLDRDFIRARLLDQGLSATAINNYLECHWQYIHRSLLRVPSAPDKFLTFGTAIHAALRTFFDAWRGGEDIGPERMIERFNWSLERQPLSSADTKALKEKGETALRGYYAHGKGLWPRNVKNEYRINGVTLDIDNEGTIVPIPLSGSLDKVEIADHGGVNVIDYKTGKPKSRNALEGKTKDGDRNYIRQLTFYKLLLEKFEKDGFVMDKGTIEFVEPNDSGKYVKESFDISDESVVELEEEVKRVAHEIYNLTFWGKRCEQEKCEYCDLYVPLAEMKT